MVSRLFAQIPDEQGFPMMTLPRCCLSCRAVHCRTTKSSSAFSRCSSRTSCASSTGWRRGSSSSWCPTPPFSSPSRTRAWPVEAHFVKLAFLARQSHRPPTRVGCATEEGGWFACIRDVLGGVEPVLFSSHLSFAVRVSGGFCMLSL